MVATALAVAKAIGKTPVLVENREGFVVNRLFIPYLMEAFWLLEEGVEPGRDRSGHGRLRLRDGPAAVDRHVRDLISWRRRKPSCSRHFRTMADLPPIARRLVEGGHLGQKTGAGVYRYEPGDRTPRAHELTEQAVAAARKPTGHTAGDLDGGQIVSRLMLRMAAEAFAILEEKIVERPADIDVAMVLGTGLADFRGGVLKYACDLGLDRTLAELRRLSEQCGSRYLPGRLLEEAAGDPSVLKF